MLRDVAEIVVLAVGLYLIATTTVQTVHVVGISMTPTLQNDDLLIASKIDYRLHAPERGDIIILKSPIDPGRDYIKRVVGLPGDHILIRDHHVLVNGVVLNEPYIEQGWVATENWPNTPDEVDGEVVPAGSYFVLGDNRDHSSDSRLFGYVTLSEIDGKALFRFWPYQRMEVLNVRPTLAKE